MPLKKKRPGGKKPPTDQDKKPRGKTPPRTLPNKPDSRKKKQGKKK